MLGALTSACETSPDPLDRQTQRHLGQISGGKFRSPCVVWVVDAAGVTYSSFSASPDPAPRDPPHEGSEARSLGGHSHLPTSGVDVDRHGSRLACKSSRRHRAVISPGTGHGR